MSQTNLFTEQETKKGMEILQTVLKRLFAAGATPNVSDLPAISEAVAKAFGTGEYPMVNMYMVMLQSRNPDMAMIFGVFMAAVVEAIRVNTNTNTTKQ